MSIIDNGSVDVACLLVPFMLTHISMDQDGVDAAEDTFKRFLMKQYQL